MSIVEVQNLHKSFSSISALKDVQFEVKKGELFGFIGPDGAGKTTLFRILTSLLTPDSGMAQVLGYDVVNEYRKLRPKLGYMPGRFSLYTDLTVEENMHFFASVFGTSLKENYSLVEPIYKQIEPFKDRLAGNLSGGMKQKLALSCALIHKPDLLILDEPTTGVDAVSRTEFWEMLQNLKKEGITIIVSTPYMDEAKLCDRVALIQNGKLMDLDSPDGIVSKFKDQIFGIRSEHTYHLLQTLKDYEFSKSVHPFGEFIHYIDKRPNSDSQVLHNFLSANGITDAEIKMVKPTIEDCFMSLMQREEKNV